MHTHTHTHTHTHIHNPCTHIHKTSHYIAEHFHMMSTKTAGCWETKSRNTHIINKYNQVSLTGIPFHLSLSPSHTPPYMQRFTQTHLKEHLNTPAHNPALPPQNVIYSSTRLAHASSHGHMKFPQWRWFQWQWREWPWSSSSKGKTPWNQRSPQKTQEGQPVHRRKININRYWFTLHALMRMMHNTCRWMAFSLLAFCLSTVECKHKHKHPYTHTHTHTLLHRHTHIFLIGFYYLWAHTHTSTHTHTHTHTLTNTDTHMHSLSLTHTHTHTHTQTKYCCMPTWAAYSHISLRFVKSCRQWEVMDRGSSSRIDSKQDISEITDIIISWADSHSGNNLKVVTIWCDNNSTHFWSYCDIKIKLSLPTAVTAFFLSIFFPSP